MYQNCCKKCGSLQLHTEIKGNNTGLFCSDCGAYIKWLGKDELRAFENSLKNASTSQNNISTNQNLPKVLLIENGDEELFINGESVCCHDRLYLSEVLQMLADYGIIDFTYRQ